MVSSAAKPKHSKKIWLIIGIAAVAAAVAAFFAVKTALDRAALSGVQPQDGDYYLIDCRDSAGSDCLPQYFYRNDMPFCLTVRGGSGQVNNLKGRNTAQLSLDFDKKQATLTRTNSGAVETCSLDAAPETVTLHLTAPERVAVYRRNTRDDLKPFIGQNAVVGSSFREHEDYLAYCANNRYKLVSALTLGDDGKAKITCADGSENAAITLEENKMTGSVAYQSSEDSYDAFLVTDGELLRVYSAIELVSTFRKADAHALDAFIGDCAVVRVSSETAEDYLAYCTENSRKNIAKLTLGAESKGEIRYDSGEAYASFTCDASTMTEKITYAKSGKTYDLVAAAEGDLLKLYSDADLTYYFRKEDAHALDRFLGQSVIVKSSTDKHPDLLSYCADHGAGIPSSLTLNSDGTGSITCLDGSVYATLTCDPAAMTGSVSYRDGGKAYDLLLAADGDLLKLYSDARQTCCFRKADARLLDGFIGESVAVHGSSQAHADLPAACAVTGKKIISKLLLRGDGTGTISYLDGSEYASLTYRTDTMTGELTDRTGKKKGDLVMAVDNGTLWLYSQAKQTLGFKVADTIPLEAYEGELTIRSYAAEGSEDLLALRRHNKQKVPSAVILGKDGKGEVRLEDGTVFFGFSFQASDMTLSADINGKQHNGLLCVRDDGTVRLYIEGHGVITADKGAAQNIKS